MANINFVSQRLKKLTRLEKKDKEIFKISAVVTSILLLILAAVSAYGIYLNSQLKKVESSQKSFLNRIKQQEDKEKSFVLFVGKLRVLSEVFQDRKDKQDAINYFSQIFGSDVTIEKIAYDAESELLSFRLIAADIFTLESVFELLSSNQSTQRFSSLSRNNLQRTSTGVYQMQITVAIEDEVESE